MTIARPLLTASLDHYELADRYRRESGRVLLSGTQALVRIPLMQRAKTPSCTCLGWPSPVAL